MLIGLVVVAATVNVLQFRSIEHSADVRYAALGRLPALTLEESLSEAPAIAQMYDLFFQLSELAPGSEIQISTNSTFPIPSFRDNALGFGRAHEVITAEFDEAADDWFLADDLAAEQMYHVEASGTVWLPHQGDTPWQIITGDCSSGSAGDPKSFAVFRLNAAAARTLLLVETCLTPDSLVSAR